MTMFNHSSDFTDFTLTENKLAKGSTLKWPFDIMRGSFINIVSYIITNSII